MKVLFKGLKGFLETSFVDWPGRLCGVLFLGGCNFRCPYCHNPDLVLAPQQMEDLRWEAVRKRLQELGGWLDGVCVTGGEPTLNPHLPYLLEEIRSLGLLVKLDTNGSRPKVLNLLIQHGLIQAVSMDIKAPLEEGPYRRCSGVDAPLGEVARSVELLGSCGLEVEFRTTVVPELLGKAEILSIARALPRAGRYTLQAFRPASTLDPEMRLQRPCPQETLEELMREVQAVRSAPIPTGLARRHF